MGKYLLIAGGVLLLAGCSEPVEPKRVNTPAVQPDTDIVKAGRPHDTASIVRGSKLFQQHCAVCHGEQGQGTVNWHKRDKDGKSPPPPLNGLGHTWHHPLAVLKYTVKNGTGKIGGNMPAFAGKLTDEQIEDVFIFVQEKWPDPIYEAWYRTDEIARNRVTK